MPSTWPRCPKKVIEMDEKTAAGWHSYSEVSELIQELDLNDEDMAQARELTDDHIPAWHLAQVRSEQDRTQEEVALVMGVKTAQSFRDREYRLS
jgi:hypothetical protein